VEATVAAGVVVTRAAVFADTVGPAFGGVIVFATGAIVVLPFPKFAGFKLVCPRLARSSELRVEFAVVVAGWFEVVVEALLGSRGAASVRLLKSDVAWA
jgi:hypothetical protein